LIIEEHTLTRETSDKVHLLLNVNEFTEVLFDTNLITSDTNFLQHPQNTDYSLGLPSLDVFPTDDVLAYSQFSIDFNSLESDGINILRVQHQLLMTKIGEADILLEDNSYTTTASAFLNGYVPIIDVEQNREFRLTDGDDRKLVQVKRDSINDSGTIFAYKTLYPFFVRWETWEALTGVTNPPSGVYDATLPNNGLNHYWQEVSLNNINIDGSGTAGSGWYTLPQPRAYYVDANGDGNLSMEFGRAANDCTAVADADVDFSPYVGINLMFNSDLDGYAWGGGMRMTLDGVSKYWNMTWEPPWGYAQITVMSHEMGHGFGLPHSANQYDEPYENAWDVMSNAWYNCDYHVTYGCLGQHTIAHHKNMLGWIAPGD
jgi:M6 family metalloprotease-like protein